MGGHWHVETPRSFVAHEPKLQSRLHAGKWHVNWLLADETAMRSIEQAHTRLLEELKRHRAPALQGLAQGSSSRRVCLFSWTRTMSDARFSPDTSVVNVPKRESALKTMRYFHEQLITVAKLIKSSHPVCLVHHQIQRVLKHVDFERFIFGR